MIKINASISGYSGFYTRCLSLTSRSNVIVKLTCVVQKKLEREEGFGPVVIIIDKNLIAVIAHLIATKASAAIFVSAISQSFKLS